MYVGEAETPKPDPGQVLIKVAYFGINRADTLQRSGKYPPPKGVSTIMGLEVSGIVESVNECNSISKGAQVMALLAGGGYAEYVVADEGCVIVLPEAMDLCVAGAVCENYLTAFQLLETVGECKAGSTVLIHAGASGVGTAAIQLAKTVFKAGKVIVTAGSQDKLNKCIELGASQAVNRHGDWSTAIEPGSVDLVLDCVGASYADMNLKVLGIESSWVLYGLMGGAVCQDFPLGSILRKRIRLEGTTLRARSLEYKSILVSSFCEKALPKIADGEIKVVVDSVFTVDRIVDAHAYMEANSNTGKILIKW